ncbi:MAG: hypothetical protein FWH07_01370 [Oscillospiraceae bacterium]|nr:hypothetical protein [Oscillospiraceae bacterium]
MVIKMKKKRLQEILDIVQNAKISGQDMLLSELRKRGIIVTQPTLSRDMSQLGLVKAVTDDGDYCYIVPERAKIAKISGMFSQAVKSINPASNIVVIKTYGGMASAVCSALDLKDIPLIAGTIAGDDTIFAVTRSEKDARELSDKLKKFL